MEWTTATSLAFRLGKKAYDSKHLIQRYWTRVKVYLDKGATQVVITGHAGAGKTLLASQMHGRARDLAFELPKESRTVEVEVFDSSTWSRIVRVLPGQDGFRAQGVVQAFVANDKLEGVIHLVDYGYVAPRDPIVAASLIQDDKLETISKLRNRNLQFEIEQLRILLSDVKRSYALNKCPKWIIIAVNKVDLFADQRDAALKYYHPQGFSEFSSTLRNFQNEIGSTNISIYVVQSSAYELDFEWNGEKSRSLLERQEQNSILLEFTQALAAIMENHQ